MQEQIICKFNFVCDQKWNDLREIERNESARFCTICEKPVYLTSSYEELVVNVAAKRCVAIRALPPLDLSDGSMLIGDVAPPSHDSLGIDPIFGRPVENLGLTTLIVSKLSECGIRLIGDLVQLPLPDVSARVSLTHAELDEMNEALSSRGLTLGKKVENWGEYVERRRLKQR